MSPEMIQLLALPFFTVIGVLIKSLWDWLTARMTNRVSTKQVQISETEANTRQFQAIVEGFTQSLAAVSARAQSAEERAGKAEASSKLANDRAETLEGRLDDVEREREHERAELINHLNKVELLVPNPPGPPPRPPWLVL